MTTTITHRRHCVVLLRGQKASPRYLDPVPQRPDDGYSGAATFSLVCPSPNRRGLIRVTATRKRRDSAWNCVADGTTMETPDTQLQREPCGGTLEQGGKHVAQTAAAATTKKKNLLDKRGTVLSVIFQCSRKPKKQKSPVLISPTVGVVWV